MSRRTSPPFRADHVGSLLRPKRLHEARGDFAAGRTTAGDLPPVQDRERGRAGRRPMLGRAVYPGMEPFWAALAAGYAGEVARRGALGCTCLQFDDTSLAYLNDPAQRAEITGRGEDAEHMHLRYIAQINAAVKGRPAGMAITTHLCRGNFRPSCAPSGGDDFVAQTLFPRLGVYGV